MSSIQRLLPGAPLSEAVVFNGMAFLAAQVPEDTSRDAEGQTHQVRHDAITGRAKPDPAPEPEEGDGEEQDGPPVAERTGIPAPVVDGPPLGGEAARRGAPMRKAQRPGIMARLLFWR